jgi:hypothetical protein
VEKSSRPGAVTDIDRAGLVVGSPRMAVLCAMPIVGPVVVVDSCCQLPEASIVLNLARVGHLTRCLAGRVAAAVEPAWDFDLDVSRKRCLIFLHTDLRSRAKFDSFVWAQRIDSFTIMNPYAMLKIKYSMPPPTKTRTGEVVFNTYSLNTLPDGKIDDFAVLP